MTTDAWTRSAAQSRDEATFDALFLTHYQPIFRLLYRIAGTREEAEDLAQETFLRLHRSPELWKGTQPEPREHNVRAWLYRVATNLAYNMLRSQQRRTSVARMSFSGKPSALGSSEPDPVEAAEREDERAAVRACPGELCPSARPNCCSCATPASAIASWPRRWASRQARWAHRWCALRRRSRRSIKICEAAKEADDEV